MPGFPRGGLAVDELAEGINVIYGPNASGKTTLTRAMQRLLRPNGAGRQTDSLAADLSIAGRVVQLDYHLGQVVCRSMGAETSIPPLAPGEVCDRYVLALHDLVGQENDSDIVEQILREAAGGYDISAAAEQLGFDRDRPKSRSYKPATEAKEATHCRRNAEAQLVEIEREEQKLSALERSRDQAAEAQRRQRLLEDALEALEVNRRLEQARGALAEFPEGLSKLTGDEWQRLCELKSALQREIAKQTTATNLLDRANADLLASGLPDEGVPAELIGTLQKRCETLRECEREIRRLESELAASETAMRETVARIGPDASVERAANLDSASVNALFDFIRKVEELGLDANGAEQLTDWLKVVPSGIAAPDTLRDGMLLLQQWLAQQRHSRTNEPRKGPWFVAAVMTAVVAAVMAFVHMSWLLLLLPAIGMAAWPFVRPSLAVPPTTLQEIPGQWSGLGLPPPTDWTPAAIQALLRRLEQEWATAQLSWEKSQRFADLEKRRQKLQKRQQEIDQARQGWRTKLGIDIEPGDARIYLLAQAIAEYQSTQARQKAKESELTNVRGQYCRLLREVHAGLAPHFSAPAADADQASAQVHDLSQRREAHCDAIARRQQANDAQLESNRLIAELQDTQSALLDSLALNEEGEATLRTWCEQFPDYKASKESLRLAEHDAETRAAALAGNPELLKQTREQLEAELESCRRSAAELPELDQQIGDIKGRVRRAKEETALEAALAHEQECLANLRVERENDAAQLVGNALIGYLERQQRDVQQPAVLKRAVELFAAVTHGRYQLKVRPAGQSTGPPGFVAVDTSLGCEQGLEELSCGTRLQLLLAVRVAFVEQQEQGLQLPLLLDETLANSDERRAANIVASAIEIARRGRQVFYFTARHDELAKWRQALNGRGDLTYREIDLAQLRGFSEIEYAPPVEYMPAQASPVPSPGGDDWYAYGRRLNVPSLDRRAHLGGIHLWYVIDDVNELHRLLAGDINKWGQLQTLVETGSADGINKDSLAFRRAFAAAKLLEHLFRFWRQGRGEPVDRSVLEASKAITPAFLDKVSQLAESLRGDARELVHGLRDGRVPRIRGKDVEALTAYLEEHGYLDDQPILEPSQIREMVAPLMFNDRDAGLISSEQVDRLASLVLADSPVSAAF
jgi:energy-coupling factor transporter ATP-binding protein EcfA2